MVRRDAATGMMSTEQQARADTVARRVREGSRALLIYGLLAGGSAVFVLPFVWMVGTSFKVDREMFGEKITLLPMRPIPAVASPYLDDSYYRRPESSNYKRTQATIADILGQADLPLPSYVAGRDRAPDILARGLFSRLEQFLPGETWELPTAELSEVVRSKATPELLTEVIDKVYRHLSFAAVRVRSFEVQEKDVTEGAPLSSFWEIHGGAPARLEDHGEGVSRYADLVYDFSQAGAGGLRLSRTIQLPFSADRLYRTQIFLRPDDSWHKLEFYVEKNGKLLRGMRPEYLGNFQWSIVTLQDYGPDDESNKIRLWIPLEEADAGPQYESRPDHLKLTVVMTRSSQAGAWWAKIQRNYRGALDYIPFWKYAATSAFLVILNILGNIISCSLVAYAFARLQWPGRNLSFGVMLATMMIPPQVTMIPYFLIVKHLGWFNTLKPLWVVSFFGNAFNIFLLRQFMKGIPRDLEDAARIDGCNFIQIYWYVIMPLIKPTLACIAIFTFMGVWNDFMGPLIYLSDQRLYPLSLGLYAFNVQAGANYGMMMAGSLLMTLPVIAIFFFAQKYFIQGVTLTGMKG